MHVTCHRSGAVQGVKGNNVTIFEIFRNILKGRSTSEQGEQQIGTDIFLTERPEQEQGQEGEYVGRHRYVYEDGAFMSERVPVIPGPDGAHVPDTEPPTEVIDTAQPLDTVHPAQPLDFTEPPTEVFELPARWLQGPIHSESRRVLGEALILDVRPAVIAYPSHAHDITGEFRLTGANA